MVSKQPPLDELVWQSSEAAAYVGQGWGVHNNNVLYYFAESPFFDRTSNNQIVRTQAEMPGREYMIETRAAFEGELRKRSGLEYVVASDQTQFGHPDYPNSMGRWVIHKQRRVKQPNADDQVELLATYFVIGDMVYMAPSVLDVLWNRVLAITEQMNQFMDTASGLPSFTPAHGYQYVDPALRRSQPGRSSTGTSAAPSRSVSPTPGQEETALNSSQEAGADSSRAQPGTSSYADTQTLIESFRTFQRYGHEYMDEVPLVGEPGSFSFANRPAAARPTNVRQTPSSSSTTNPTNSQSDAAHSSSTQPQTATQDSAKTDSSSKTSKDDKPAAPKLKRRKSKAPTSPTSASSPSSPLSAAPSPMNVMSS